MVNSSIFISPKIDNIGEPLGDKISDMYKTFLNYLADKKGLQINLEERAFVYKDNNKKIKMHVRFWFYSSLKRFFLYISPAKSSLEESLYSIGDLQSTFMKFINISFSDGVNIGNIHFDRLSLEEQKDISDWKVLLFNRNNFTYSEISLLDFMNNKKDKIKEIFDTNSNRGNNIYLLSPEIKQEESPLYDPFIRILNNLIRKNITSNVVKIDYDLQTVENLLSGSNMKDSFIVLVLPEGSEEKYNNLKCWLIENRINSQCIQINTLRNKAFKDITLSIKNNLLLEMSSKLGEELIMLDPSVSKVNNIIYLTDIDEPNNLFSVSIDKIEKNKIVERVKILKNIKFEIDEFQDAVKLDEGSLDTLIKIIKSTDLVKDSADIYVTKRWDKKQIEKFTDKLKENNISVRNIFYISTRAIKGVVDNSAEKYKFYYKKIDNRAVIIKTVNTLKWYGDLFPIWCEKIYPNEDITSDDIDTILWSIKKRIYRIDNFDSLKIPEIFSLLKSQKKKYLSLIRNNLDLDIATLL